MLRAAEDCWFESGASLLASQWRSPTEVLQRVCAQIEIIRDVLQIHLARTFPGGIVGPDVILLERLWGFSRFSQMLMCLSRP